MSASRDREAKRNRQQERTRAQKRSEQVRRGLEELGLPQSPELQPGDSPWRRRERPGPSRRRPTTLTRLLGSRPPVVLLHLSENDGRIAVRISTRPRSVEAGEALKELAALLEHAFREGRSHFTDAQWQRLLGHEPAPVGERLLLLTRLAIPAATAIRTPALSFTPDNRGLRHYHAKFAALPDGLPFSLRLLLPDRRGRKPASPSADADFLDLPEPVLLLAVRKTLAAERQLGQVWSDYDIGPPLKRTLESLGVALATAPSDVAVRRLRERWKRRGLSLFPKASDRERAEVARNNPGPAGEMLP
jgi:hypothetical protein